MLLSLSLVAHLYRLRALPAVAASQCHSKAVLCLATQPIAGRETSGQQPLFLFPHGSRSADGQTVIPRVTACQSVGAAPLRTYLLSYLEGVWKVWNASMHAWAKKVWELSVPEVDILGVAEMGLNYGAVLGQ